MSRTKGQPPDAAFARRLRRLREARRISQADLARRLGVSQRTVSAYETGAAWPPPPTLLRLSDEFGIAVDELLGRKKLRKRLEGSEDSREMWTRLQRVRRLTERDRRLVFAMINRLLNRDRNGDAQAPS